MLEGAWAAARNLLLVRLDNIGDVILLSAALRTVKENLPDARVTLLAGPAGSPLLPWIDDIKVWRALWQDVRGQMPMDPIREMELVRFLERKRYDAAVIFTSFSQSPHGPAYACYLAGIPLRLGESKEFGGGLLTTELRNMQDGLYQAERAIQLLECVGFEASSRAPRVVVPARARLAARELLARLGLRVGDPYLIVQPGASCQARRYPLARFAEVAHLLHQRLGMPVLLPGSAREAPDIEAVAARSAGLLSIAGRTRVEDLAGLVGGATAVVCNDSLPMHLCAALAVPCVVLFSGTDLESQWRSPYTPMRLLRRETLCSPCYLFQCPHDQECLDIPPLEVVQEVYAMLEGLEGALALPDEKAGTAVPEVGLPLDTVRSAEVAS